MRVRILLLVFLYAVILTAQEKSFKFGKVSKAEVEQAQHPIEKDAEAAILYKKERVFYEYIADDGFKTVRDVQYRIKIYNKSGLGWGTIEIPLYKNENGEERISQIKAYTYNMVNGKVEETKLKKDGIFDGDVNKYRNKTSIVMPEIKEGSVIDVEYRITSDFSSYIDDFQFQYGIPVDVVNVKVEIPQYFFFKRFGKGFFPIDIKQYKKHRTISVTYKTENKGQYAGSGRRTKTGALEFSENVYEVNTSNIPSLKEADYTDNINNYRSALKFELASTQFPNSLYKNYSVSWDDVAESIYKYDDFGGELKKEKVIRDIVDQLGAENEDREILAEKIFEYVKGRMTWNGYYSYACENGIKKAFNEKKGNVADINIMLTVMLRYAGFNANPVLVSTKSHGIPLFPTNEGFNYIISAIENSDGTYMLLDATEKMAPMGILPVRALNWKGRLVRDDGTSAEIDLTPRKPAKKMILMNANLFEDGSVEGKMRTQLTASLAFDYREAHKDESLEDIVEGMETRYLEMEVDNMEIKNQQECYKPLEESCSFVKENQIEMISGKLYFKPALFLTINENPFKMEKRDYPVDFKFPQTQDLTINFKIPENYKIESIPESTAIGLPDDMGVFRYTIKQNGSFLHLKSKININAGIVPPIYYKTLKEFYNQIIVKQSERVVLTKA
ncbi:DUF3857 domain-containing protein [Allomuricauda sp. d1]|uniref:DUF3857 domain-containing protein n=1 Tax=Allomuricauda sp. d1 TaxID=3136725 RepID=UPI0031E2E929